MSYKMVVEFTCDNCGIRHAQENLNPPSGWFEPVRADYIEVGPHVCCECVLDKDVAVKYLGRVQLAS